MAHKRFTDIEKWKDEWFLELNKEEKIVWVYLVDTCTNGGRWKKSFKHLNFSCDTTLKEDDLEKIFAGRLFDCGSFYFIPKFLKFQYPKGLNSKKPAILSVRNEILEYNLLTIVRERLGNDFLIIKEKDKEKDKDKDKEKDKRIVKERRKNKNKYEDFVYLTQDEYQKLVDNFGKTKTKELIQALNDYIGSKGKRYKSHYHTLLVWTRKNGILQIPKSEHIPDKKPDWKPIPKEAEKKIKELTGKIGQKI